jgi:hypothetical protein
LREGTIKSASISTNQKPCDCAFCVQERKITELRLKGSLTRIQEQLDQSLRKNKEYEKTTKMLRLLDNERSIND